MNKISRKERVYMLYAKLFGQKRFAGLNRFMFDISLRGLGVLNWRDGKVSGEKAWLKQYLSDKKMPLVIDVGAHIGNYIKDTLDAHPGSSIIAFEPHPNTFRRLSENIDHENVVLKNLGVGKRHSVLPLYDHASLDGSQHASLYENVITKIHGGDAIAHDVEIVTLDEMFKDDHSIKIDLLKIDTEGNELDVLLGATELLKNRRIKAVQFEFNEMNIESGHRFKDFFEFLHEYDFFRILASGELLRIHHRYHALHFEIYAFQNVVALLKREYR